MGSEWPLELRADLPGSGAEVQTPTFRESGFTNSDVLGKWRYKLQYFEKRSWCSGSGVHCILSDNTTADEAESKWEEQNDDPHSDLPLPFIHIPALPLPSSLGCRNCNKHGLAALGDLELQLHIGQANDTLQSIHFTLADKVVLFHTEVHHTSNQSANTRMWGKVHQADTMLSRHAQIYRKCRKAMVALEADEVLLERYKLLVDQDLKVTTAISDPNGSIHRMEKLAWF
ncbi:hypothetical protein PAXRUDRAFT_167416 [Paxillus rubicundulus Ve08.2h10]|uniref:Uncharacterized protein n=1 Tax=Paxillus rubicundulus Ve08.2h10 TaxID=930991 RepID=A0A0D0CPM0_9AGAM|nr:hypothetical protein PAXRUDRAFT_167416 [Paxillus rubicundulus Ve08.2h10]